MATPDSTRPRLGRNPSPAELRAHVVAICECAGIRIDWSSPARALRGLLELQTPEIRGPVYYATAMHELGHMLGRYQTSRSTITCEHWAWEWARQNALIWTSVMEEEAAVCMAWYREKRWPPVSDFDRQSLGYELDMPIDQRAIARARRLARTWRP